MAYSLHQKRQYSEHFDIDRVVQEDGDPRKVDMSRTLFRTEMGFPWVLPLVRDIKMKMAINTSLTHEDIFSLGMKSFRKAATELVFGKHCLRVVNEEVLTVQAPSAITALRLISEIARNNLKYKHIYVPSPICEYYNNVFKVVGFSEVKTYRYYNSEKHQLDLEGMVEDLQKIPDDSVIVLQGCCHEPSGCDPSKNQWITIAEAIREELFPIMHLTYQGLATGDLDEDAFPIRLFANLGMEMAVAVSFTMNFLLYNNSVGAASFVLKNKDYIAPLKSQLSTMISGHYGSPPYHGVKIVTTILNNETLFDQWKKDLKTMVEYTNDMRNAFVDALQLYNVAGNWDHIRNGTGSFAITELTDRQVQHLIFYHHIYVMKEGRINISGLNSNNVDYVAEAVANAIMQYPRFDVNE